MLVIEQRSGRRLAALLPGAVVLAVSLGIWSSADAEQAAAGMLLFVGTYTTGDSTSEGIYAYRFDDRDGSLQPLGLAAAIANPSFLALHPNGEWLYAVSEVGEHAGVRSGAVSAFRIDRTTARLTLLNQQLSHGTGPCHLSVDPAGRHLLVANYGSGTVASLPIGADGRLGEASSVMTHAGSGANPKRQAGPHAHWISADPTGRYVLAADLGIDQVLVYRFDQAAGTLSPHDPPSARLAPGAGPRHVAFSPGGQYVYVINELASSITAFAWDSQRGTLQERQTVPTLPEGFDGGNSTAQILAHPSGRFVYGSNRGHDSVAVFSVDSSSGRLTPVQHQPSGGSTPRNFSIDPAGRWLIAANQRTNTLVPFRIDGPSGRLTPAGHAVEVPSPVCVLFVP